ncbi:MAG: methyltransferase family protein [Chloroflexota bacterium]
MSDYGLWPIVIVNTALFVIFAFSFTRPRTWRDWRSLGAFSAFLVALFTEMYGFPLTVYLLSGWLSSRFLVADPFSHDAGHLWATLLGWQGDPHATPVHMLSDLLIFVGMGIVALSWPILHRAQKRGELATAGPYRLIRHPQYVGFIAVLAGFLIQWPTIPTALMFPVLVVMYRRLARREEAEALAQFGERYARYAASTPRFLPRFGRAAQTPVAGNR